MKLGIRFKLVSLLVTVALLPLAAAVITIAVGGGQLRSGTLGQSLVLLASAEATERQVILTKDIEKIQVVMAQETVLAELAKHTIRRTDQELAKLDADWPKLPESAPAVLEVARNPITQLLRETQRADTRLTDFVVTDRFGQLVASISRTKDFYHGDEDWWLGANNKGNPRIYLPEVNYDEGAHAWSASIAIPIVDSRNGLLGVALAVFDITPWVERSLPTVQNVTASFMLVNRDGVILYRRGSEPLTTTLGGWQAVTHADSPGWRIYAGEIQAYAPIIMPTRIGMQEVSYAPRTVVLFVPESVAIGPIQRLTWAVLTIGLGIIAAIFLAGLMIIDRSLVRRALSLAQTTRRVAGGDLTHRAARDWGRRLLGSDEIDDLARDFNNMIDRVQRSHEALMEANKLKMRFIRIAGHELRTPVSYILAMARLLRDIKDPERLTFAVQSMGSKAKRLDEIIRAMFKLIPDAKHAEELNYGDVNISDLLEEVYLDTFPFVEKRDQRLVIEMSEQAVVIRADREKLRDVVENLVMNAVKFTPDGGEVRIKVSSQLGGRLSIAVQDHGPGIPQADLPHIFEPFYTGGDVMQHSTGTGGDHQKHGMGLGLAIVMHFVNLHGGSVGVSTGPSGSTFTVSLPMDQPPKA